MVSPGDEVYLAGDVSEATHHVVEGRSEHILGPGHLDLAAEVALRHRPHDPRHML